MKKIIILIPVFNDWKSLKKLLNEINKNIKPIKDFYFECLIINDASTEKKPIFKKPKNFKSLKFFNMRLNTGHARCNAFGIRYANKNIKFDYLILMDGDGEDRPVEIKDFVNTIRNYPNISVVAKRVKRSEGTLFQFLYKIHKILTYFFTGQKIDFGNYTCLTKKDVQKLYNKASLWNSFSGSVKKYLKTYNEISSTRGLRYFGPSKMSFYKLLLHSFAIISVFKYQVFLRSAFLIILIYFLDFDLNSINLSAQILTVLFCSIIFLISFRENETELLNSHKNLKNIKKI